MDIRPKLYPYPVLADYLDDYVESRFDSIVDISKLGHDIKLDFVAETNNVGLKEQINLGNASFVFHLECAQTGFRKAITTDENMFSRLISQKDVNGKLQVCSFIIATRDIEMYTNDKFNNDYKGYTFNIEQGCVMAVGQQVNFDIEKEIDDLVSTPSIFTVIRNADTEKKEMQVDLIQQKIVVRLHEDDFINYKILYENFEYRQLLNSLVIVPALVVVLEEINKKDHEDLYEFEDHRWYRALKKTLKKFDCNIDEGELKNRNIFELSQQLIGVPINASLSVLTRTGNEEEEEEE